MPSYENEQPKPQFVKNPDEVGACWEKFNDKNIEYLSLKVELDGKTYNLKGFLNGRATNENHPKFIIYLSKNIKKEVNGNK